MKKEAKQHEVKKAFKLERIFSSLKSEINVSSFIKLPILMLAAYFILYLHKIIPCSTLSDSDEKIYSLEWFGFMSFFILMLVSFIWDSLSNRKIFLPTGLSDVCQECLENKIDNELNLDAYDLITIKNLLNDVERNLNKGDEVVIYTSLLGLEKKVEKIVAENHRKGVIYNILFYKTRDWDEFPEYLYNEKIDLNEEGYDKGIDFELSKNIGFDLFIVKRQNSNEPEAYFAVNYSFGVGSCITNAVESCDNPCDKRNTNLFFKKTNDKIALAVYEFLHGIIKDVKRKKGHKDKIT
jgi:hypothetical protein